MAQDVPHSTTRRFIEIRGPVTTLVQYSCGASLCQEGLARPLSFNGSLLKSSYNFFAVL